MEILNTRFPGNNFLTRFQFAKNRLPNEGYSKQREREGEREILSPITFIESLEREDVAGTIEDYDSIDHLGRRN